MYNITYMYRFSVKLFERSNINIFLNIILNEFQFWGNFFLQVKYKKTKSEIDLTFWMKHLGSYFLHWCKCRYASVHFYPENMTRLSDHRQKEILYSKSFLIFYRVVLFLTRILYFFVKQLFYLFVWIIKKMRHLC